MAANLVKNDASFVQMVILTDDRQKLPLTQAEASAIEQYIFDQIGAKRPRFKAGFVFSFDDGAIIINTHVDSVSWLKQVVTSYKQKVLRITDIENSPQYSAKVKADVSHLNRKAAANLLDLLEVNNFGLQTKGWRIMGFTEAGYLPNRIGSVTILIDDLGRKMLEENDFKLFVGFSTLKFQLLGRVKRCEKTGKLCTDDIPSHK